MDARIICVGHGAHAGREKFDTESELNQDDNPCTALTQVPIKKKTKQLLLNSRKLAQGGSEVRFNRECSV